METDFTGFQLQHNATAEYAAACFSVLCFPDTHTHAHAVNKQSEKSFPMVFTL